MTTTSSGGRITGLLALTCATDVALAEGDVVHMVGDYKVGLADGTKALVGSVSVRSVKRTTSPTSSEYPVATTTGGQVTVEALGFSVQTRTAGEAIAAGAEVGINSDGDMVTLAASTAKYGIALTHSTAAAQDIDVLVTGGSPVVDDSGD